MAADGRRSGYDREYRALMRRVRLALGVLVLLAVVFGLLFGVLLQGDDGMRPAFKKGQPVV